APMPGVVARARAFDLDHLGAEVGQQHGGVGAGEHATEVGDHQPVERACHRKAAWPVSALPMDSWCISEVPSWVSTDSRLLAWRITGYSRVMPLAPRMVRHSRAMAMASRTLLSLPVLICSGVISWRSLMRPRW